MKEEDFNKLKTEVLRKVGLVNIQLRRKVSLNVALENNNITEKNLIC